MGELSNQQIKVLAFALAGLLLKKGNSRLMAPIGNMLLRMAEAPTGIGGKVHIMPEGPLTPLGDRLLI